MTEYLFGFRHSIDGELKIERIEEHVWGSLREKSGFFPLLKSEHISAVIINPHGTLPKLIAWVSLPNSATRTWAWCGQVNAIPTIQCRLLSRETFMRPAVTKHGSKGW